MAKKRDATTSANASWITTSLNQRDAQRIVQVMRTAYDESPTDPYAGSAERENSLAELIEDTEDMMRDAGFDPTAVPRALTELSGDLLVCNDRESCYMALVTGLVGMATDHHVMMYIAHQQMISAKAAQDAGQTDKALQLTVLGAQFLARAVAAEISAQRRKGADKMHAADPASKAMKAVRDEFYRWQRNEVRYRNDAEFAIKMHAKHAGAIDNEGSIKNACTAWRKAMRSSC